VIIALFSCRLFRGFFEPHDCSPTVEGEVWSHLIELRSQMGTLVPQSTMELQSVLSQTPDFDRYFGRWQDAYDTFERIVSFLSRTEFGADLIPLMTVTGSRVTSHRCSTGLHESEFREGFIAVSEINSCRRRPRRKAHRLSRVLIVASRRRSNLRINPSRFPLFLSSGSSGIGPPAGRTFCCDPSQSLLRFVSKSLKRIIGCPLTPAHRSPYNCQNQVEPPVSIRRRSCPGPRGCGGRAGSEGHSVFLGF
jgi:hypothetical protein